MTAQLAVVMDAPWIALPTSGRVLCLRCMPLGRLLYHWIYVETHMLNSQWWGPHLNPGHV